MANNDSQPPSAMPSATLAQPPYQSHTSKPYNMVSGEAQQQYPSHTKASNGSSGSHRPSTLAIATLSSRTPTDVATGKGMTPIANIGELK